MIRAIVIAMLCALSALGGSMEFATNSYVTADTPTGLVSFAGFVDDGSGWHHYADAGGTQYKDGVAGAWTNSYWEYNTNSITVGNFAGGVDDSLHGYSYALSAGQVAALYWRDARRLNYTVATNQLASLPAMEWPPRRSGSTNLLTSIRLDPPQVPSGATLGEFRDSIGGFIGAKSGAPTQSFSGGIPQWDFASGSYFTMPSDAGSYMLGMTQCTVSVWVNQDAWVKNSYLLCSSDTSKLGISLRTGLNGAPYQGLVFYVNEGATSGAVSYTGAWTGLNEWVHLCCRWNNADGSQIWVDGIPVATNSTALLGGSISYSGNMPIIGAYSGGLNGFNGQASNIQIWDAYFSDSSIGVASQSPLVVPAQIAESGLKVWYRGDAGNAWQSDDGAHTITAYPEGTAGPIVH